ncbi:MAG: hypothetical protein IJC67_03980 [Clostridia bacterium]|nr:hypothetical protein [Clostridia bacterium]
MHDLLPFIGAVVWMIIGGTIVIVNAVRYSNRKEQMNCDEYMSRVCYLVSASPEEIFENLSMGMYNTFLEYDFDQQTQQIKIYWMLANRVIFSTYEITFEQHDQENRMILISTGLSSLNDSARRPDKIEELNCFWRYVAKAQPIPYSKVYPDQRIHS